MSGFQIDVTKLFWIGGEADDPEDLCLHGHAVAMIGDRRLEYEDATVSATALYLLKTLTEDHIIYKDNQMLPCCGFFLIPNDEGTEVSISGCPNGVDWTVRHEDGMVRLILEDGYTVSAEPEAYRREVYAFADKIRDFYNASAPKMLPKVDWERKGYLAFWAEWNRRRNGE